MSELSTANRCDQCGASNCERSVAQLTGFVLDNKQLYESVHELLLDAYRAQHSLYAKPITTFFGLNGLLLMLEFGYSGIQARDAHKRIADRSREWPEFTKRVDVPVSVASVAETVNNNPEQAEPAVRKWAELVWAAWSDEHERIKEETETRLGRRLSN